MHVQSIPQPSAKALECIDIPLSCTFFFWVSVELIIHIIYRVTLKLIPELKLEEKT